MPAGKTVFNLVTCDNNFEKEFACFLQDAPEVAAFAKLPKQFGFAIEYTDSASNLRYYEPDFVAVLADGSHYLIETKGREDVDVAHKDRAAQIWCEHASVLSGTPWRYLKVPQTEFKKLQPFEFEDLLVFAVDAPLLPPQSDVERLIKEGESETLEFKSSARWDMREGKQNPVMEKVIVKTVAGFLNSRLGGALLIGVADDGQILGLGHDYQTLGKKPDRDGYELFLTTLLTNAYGKDAIPLIRIKFPRVAGEEICKISISPSSRPIFVKGERGQEFFIRANNQTMPLSMEEAWNYSRTRWD